MYCRAFACGMWGLGCHVLQPADPWNNLSVMLLASAYLTRVYSTKWISLQIQIPFQPQTVQCVLRSKL